MAYQLSKVFDYVQSIESYISVMFKDLGGIYEYVVRWDAYIRGTYYAVESMLSQLGTVSASVVTISSTLTSVYTQLGIVSANVTTISSTLSNVYTRLGGMNTRLVEIQDILADILYDMNTMLSNIYSRLSGINSRLGDIQDILADLLYGIYIYMGGMSTKLSYIFDYVQSMESYISVMFSNLYDIYVHVVWWDAYIRGTYYAVESILSQLETMSTTFDLSVDNLDVNIDISAIEEWLDRIYDRLGDILRKMGSIEVTNEAGTNIWDVLASLLESIGDLGGALASAFASIVESIASLAVSIIEGVFDLLNTLFTPSPDHFGDFQEKVENQFSFYDDVKNETTEVYGIFSGSGDAVPDTSFSFNGVSAQLIDLSGFEMFRPTLHIIVLGVAYASYFVTLLRRVPGIIGGFSDDT